MAGWAWANQLAEEEGLVLENLALAGRSQQRIRAVTKNDGDSAKKKGVLKLGFGDLVQDVNYVFGCRVSI